MWVVNDSNDNTVTEALAGWHDARHLLAVGNSGPCGIAFDGTNMWVTNSNDNTVTELSPTGKTLSTFTV